MRRLIGLSILVLAAFAVAVQQGCSNLSLLGEATQKQIITSPNDANTDIFAWIINSMYY